MAKRIERVNELLKKELGIIIRENFNPAGVLISIHYIKTAPDIKTAKVYVSIFPFEKSKDVFDELKKITPRLQFFLNERIKMKYSPKIEIFLDESLEYESGIEDLLRKINDDNMGR